MRSMTLRLQETGCSNRKYTRGRLRKEKESDKNLCQRCSKDQELKTGHEGACGLTCRFPGQTQSLPAAPLLNVHPGAGLGCCATMGSRCCPTSSCASTGGWKGRWGQFVLSEPIITPTVLSRMTGSKTRYVKPGTRMYQSHAAE